MNKRLVSWLVIGALSAYGLALIPAAVAQPTVPDVANIEDPAGDANYLNDQGQGATIGFQGDNRTPSDVGSVSDILKVWFSDDADNVYAHFLTEAPPPASTGLVFRVFVTPTGQADNCLWFQGLVPGVAQGVPTTYQGPPAGAMRDFCTGTGAPAAGTIEFGDIGDGRGYVTIGLPRSLQPDLLKDGVVFTAPNASTRNLIGAQAAASLTAPQIDNTKSGTEYVVGSGGPGSGPQPTGSASPGPQPTTTASPGPQPTTTASPGPQPTATPSPKPKNCKKIKNKKKRKKCKKQQKPPSQPKEQCPAYVPGAQGADLPVNLVTDEHTAEAPLELVVATDPGLPEVAVTHTYVNIQIDTAAADTGLYAAFEFEPYQDYDLYLNYADGTQAARAAGFNQAPVDTPVTNGNDNENGGHTEMGSEHLDGVRTPDCAGYTIDLASYLSEGGDMTLKLWLGEPAFDPPPPGGGTIAALARLGVVLDG